jgi:hypothetical protein
MKHILHADGAKLLLLLALVFTVISSFLADRAARLETDLRQSGSQARPAESDRTPDSMIQFAATRRTGETPPLASARAH